MKITPVHPRFGGRVEGADLTRPLDPAAFAQTRDAFEEHSVLVFSDQRPTDEQQLAFSRRFGRSRRRSGTSPGTTAFTRM